MDNIGVGESRYGVVGSIADVNVRSPEKAHITVGIALDQAHASVDGVAQLAIELSKRLDSGGLLLPEPPATVAHAGERGMTGPFASDLAHKALGVATKANEVSQLLNSLMRRINL